MVDNLVAVCVELADCAVPVECTGGIGIAAMAQVVQDKRALQGDKRKGPFASSKRIYERYRYVLTGTV